MSWHRSGSTYPPLFSSHWFSGNRFLIGLLVTLILAVISETPSLPALGSSILFQVAAAGLLLLLATSGSFQDDLKTALRRGPHPLLLALLVWCVFAAAIAPYRSYAAAELLRVMLCASVYFGAAYGLRDDQLRIAVGSILFLGAATALFPFTQFGQQNRNVIGIFGNHENLGSFLVVLLPPAVALAVQNHPDEDKTRLMAQVAAVILGGALLLSRTRSAWAGAAAALITLSILFLRFGTPRLNARHKSLIVSPLVILTIGFILLIIMGEIAPLISQRFATINTINRALDDSSFANRLHRWRSAARMASEKPLMGWGLGAWPVMQGRWTHQGHEIDQVLTEGTGHPNLAHNFWVQWTAETGGIGLMLHVAFVFAFILSALHALSTVNSRFRKPLLAGCIATAMGAFVDGIGAPSYQYPGVSSLFWFWMGIGIAACREKTAGIPALPPTRPAVWWGAITAGVVAASLVLGVGYIIRREGRSQPRGTLSVVALPHGSAPAGSQVVWTAFYKDPSGRVPPTIPGTVWKVTRGRLDRAHPVVVIDQFSGVEHSGLRGRLPRGASSVTVTATYWDNYSRHYKASATVTTEPGITAPGASP